MERWKSLAGVLVPVAVVVGLEHLYLWTRLVRDAGLAPPWSHGLTLLLGVLAASVPLSVVTSRVTPPRVSKWWVTPVFTWLGVSLLLTMVLAVLDVVRLGVALPGRTAASAALVLGLSASAWAAVEGRRFHVRRVEVPLGRLPSALDGFTLVQLSDVHLGPTTGRAFLERVVDEVNALDADAVVVTGDLVDASVEALADDVAPLARLSARHGVYFVTGNHEYHAGAAAWCAHLETLGVRVLRNERVELGRGGALLDLAGTDDSDAAGRAEGFHEDLALALEGRDERRPLVLLAHQPKSVHEAARHGVDLQLSGHTHGGQLWPLGWLLRAGQPVVAGLRRFGQTFLYVSRGTGHSGPPMRLATPAEVTQVVLRHASPHTERNVTS